MARVTVEDCFQNIKNRFELVLIAVQRARDIYSGAAITLNRDNDKDVVIALREIAANTISISQVKERILDRSTSVSNHPQTEENTKAKNNLIDESITQPENDTQNSSNIEDPNKATLNSLQKKDKDEITTYTDIDMNNIFLSNQKKS